MKSTVFRAVVLCGSVAVCTASAQTKILPLAPAAVSTVPGSGDVNPYGVAFVPRTVSPGTGLQAGDVLVSNFNNVQNLQGTGRTIVRVTPSGQVSQFFSGPQSGLTAALGVLANGTVIVGNLPTADGTAATVQAGSLAFIDRNGNLLGSIFSTSVVNGPWGLAINDSNNGQAQVFVSNVLNGTIVRLGVVYSFSNTVVAVNSAVTIGSGFSHRTDPAALVLGPAGLAYDALHGVLYVASSSDNAIYALANAGTATASLGAGTLAYSDPVHLHGPLALASVPNGHLLVANSDGSNADPNQPSELVEFTTAGQFIAQYSLDPNNGGAFGVGLFNIGWGTVRLAAVDDNQNQLKLWTTVIQ